MKNTWKAIQGNNIDHPNVRTHVKNKQRYLYEANYIVSIGKYTGHCVSPVFFSSAAMESFDGIYWNMVSNHIYCKAFAYSKWES